MILPSGVGSEVELGDRRFPRTGAAIAIQVSVNCIVSCTRHTTAAVMARMNP